tara:strand:- start:2 stop:526 length:525 start_codon:yes stop_codon:yes gene_type:complete
MSLPVIYISKRCVPCRKLLILLNNKKELKGQYRLVCIDDEPFPNQLKSVPCMIIDNQIINSEDLFNHINNYEAEPESKPNKNINMNQPNEISKSENSCEIDGICLNGNCSISYSSIDDSDIGNSSYSFIDEEQKISVDIKETNNKNSRSKQFDSDYEKMMEERGKMMGGGQRFA